VWAPASRDEYKVGKRRLLSLSTFLCEFTRVGAPGSLSPLGQPRLGRASPGEHLVNVPASCNMPDEDRLSEPPQSKPPQHSQGTILIVDDEPIVLRGLASFLEQSPFDVVTCLTPHEAIGHISNGDVQVVVSDVAMPEITGIELLRMVRQHDPDLPVVLVTGKPGFKSAFDAIEYGAFLYLVKPVRADVFASAVERAARLYRLAKTKRQAIALFGEGAMDADRVGLETNFERALSGMWVAFQPIVRASDHSIFGYEALLRSNDAAMSGPGPMLHAAERLGELNRLGRAVRERAAKSISGTHRSCTLFVNLHPQDLLDPDLHSDDTALGSVAGRVVLEITERSAITDIENARDLAMGLRNRGFRIAVDDLGAGYAGLSSFALLEPEFVKLDMTLVRDVDTSPVKQKLVKSLASLCNDMGLHVVAEGIETPAERDTVVDLGCDLLQGFLFAKPGPAFPEVHW
jgi:EAL domain-containing protein (putative c-di-GMP-specific phosphodiesterase class I)